MFFIFNREREGERNKEREKWIILGREWGEEDVEWVEDGQNMIKIHCIKILIKNKF